MDWGWLKEALGRARSGFAEGTGYNDYMRANQDREFRQQQADLEQQRQLRVEEMERQRIAQAQDFAREGRQFSQGMDIAQQIQNSPSSTPLRPGEIPLPIPVGLGGGRSVNALPMESKMALERQSQQLSGEDALKMKIREANEVPRYGTMQPGSVPFTAQGGKMNLGQAVPDPNAVNSPSWRAAQMFQSGLRRGESAASNADIMARQELMLNKRQDNSETQRLGQALGIIQKQIASLEAANPTSPDAKGLMAFDPKKQAAISAQVSALREQEAQIQSQWLQSFGGVQMNTAPVRTPQQAEDVNFFRTGR
jgi:hypothetical protein